MCFRYYLIKLILILSGVFANYISYCQTPDTIRVNRIDTVYQTITVIDTVITKDTIWVDRKLDAVSLSAAFSTFAINWRGINCPELTFTNNMGYNFNFSGEIGKKSWYLYSGLGISFMKGNINFNYQNLHIDSTVFSEVIEYEHYRTDTISDYWEYFLNYIYNPETGTYDSSLDSTRHTVTETEHITVIDTIQTLQYDSLYVNHVDNKSYTYKYFEVPIKIKYRLFRTQKADVDISLGLIAGFLIQSESYYLHENQIKMLTKNDLYSFLPSLWFSAGIDYFITDFTAIRLEPFYNTGLRKINKSQIPLNKTPNRMGIYFGLKVFF